MPVVNIRKLELFGTYEVLVDRTTEWGNPFVLGKDGNRSEVIQKHHDWLWEALKANEVSLEDLADLDGKVLACWCAPLACHASTLLKAAKWAAEQLCLAPEDRMVQGE